MARRKGWGLLREKSVWGHGGGAQTPLDPRAVREDKTLAVFELRRIGPSRWTPQSTDLAGHAILFTALAEGGVEMWQAWDFINRVYGCGWHLLAVKMGEGVKCKR